MGSAGSHYQIWTHNELDILVFQPQTTV